MAYLYSKTIKLNIECISDDYKCIKHKRSYHEDKDTEIETTMHKDYLSVRHYIHNCFKDENIEYHKEIMPFFYDVFYKDGKIIDELKHLKILEVSCNPEFITLALQQIPTLRIVSDYIIREKDVELFKEFIKKKDELYLCGYATKMSVCLLLKSEMFIDPDVQVECIFVDELIFGSMIKYKNEKILHDLYEFIDYGFLFIINSFV